MAAPAAEALLAEAAGATAGLFLLLLQRRVARKILRGLWKGLRSEGNRIGILRLTRPMVMVMTSSLDSGSRINEFGSGHFKIKTLSIHPFKIWICDADPNRDL